jgi:hypothetical protein
MNPEFFGQQDGPTVLDDNAAAPAGITIRLQLLPGDSFTGGNAVAHALQGRAGCRNIPATSFRYETGNRTAMTSDDDLFSCLHEIQKRAKSVLCLKRADLQHISQYRPA